MCSKQILRSLGTQHCAQDVWHCSWRCLRGHTMMNADCEFKENSCRQKKAKQELREQRKESKPTMGRECRSECGKNLYLKVAQCQMRLTSLQTRQLEHHRQRKWNFLKQQRDRREEHQTLKICIFRNGRILMLKLWLWTSPTHPVDQLERALTLHMTKSMDHRSKWR